MNLFKIKWIDKLYIIYVKNYNIYNYYYSINNNNYNIMVIVLNKK